MSKAGAKFCTSNFYLPLIALLLVGGSIVGVYLGLENNSSKSVSASSSASGVEDGDSNNSNPDPLPGSEFDLEDPIDQENTDGNDVAGEIVPSFFEGNPLEAIDAARADIVTLLEEDRKMGPKFVRLVFHDCIGGCNGCVDLSNPDNNGLDVPMNRLKDTCSFYSNQLSRADCWVLAALTASNQMQPQYYGDEQLVDFPFQYYGRPTCEGGDEIGDAVDDIHCPDDHLTTHEVLDFFEVHFGFSPRETVAIMGAHTFGRLSPNNSGFPNSSWTNRPDTLDNEYFRLLLDRSDSSLPTDRYDQRSNNQDPPEFFWEKDCGYGYGGRKLHGMHGWGQGHQSGQGRRHDDGVGGGHDDHFGHGWGHKKRLVMLNADMALVSDFNGQINDATGEVSCAIRADVADATSTACPMADTTRDLVEEYGDDNSVWITDFRDAFLKMTIQGSDITLCADNTLCNVGA